MFYYRGIFNQIQGYPAPPLDVCLLFALLFTIFIIVVTQKLVLQQSKKRHSKVYGNPIAPSFYSILLALKYIIFALKVTNSDINISIIFSVIISIFIFDLSAYLLVTIWPDFYLKFFWNSTEENRKICNIFYLVNSYFFLLKSVAITVSLKVEQVAQNTRLFMNTD